MLLFVAPPSWVLQALFRDVLFSKYALLYEALLSHSKSNSVKYVFHIFSNGGAFFYEYLLARALQSPGTVQALGVGVVFDSAPLDLSDKAVANTAAALRGPLGAICRTALWIWR